LNVALKAQNTYYEAGQAFASKLEVSKA
jgi:hypothetical protein